jgi:hypothetical protein
MEPALTRRETKLLSRLRTMRCMMPGGMTRKQRDRLAELEERLKDAESCEDRGHRQVAAQA